jgi:hypothetical protein
MRYWDGDMFAIEVASVREGFYGSVLLWREKYIFFGTYSTDCCGFEMVGYLKAGDKVAILPDSLNRANSLSRVN